MDLANVETWIKIGPYLATLVGAAYMERVRRTMRDELDRELRLYAKREDLIRIETLTQQVREDIIEIKQMLRDSLSGTVRK
jgi:hypothetical protein